MRRILYHHLFFFEKLNITLCSKEKIKSTTLSPTYPLLYTANLRVSPKSMGTLPQLRRFKSNKT